MFLVAMRKDAADQHMHPPKSDELLGALAEHQLQIRADFLKRKIQGLDAHDTAAIIGMVEADEQLLGRQDASARQPSGEAPRQPDTAQVAGGNSPPVLGGGVSARDSAEPKPARKNRAGKAAKAPSKVP